MLGNAFVLYGNGDAEMRKTMDKVGRAIQWIDYPAPFGIIALARLKTRLFTQKTVLGIAFAQRLDQQLFSQLVETGHIARQSLAFHLKIQPMTLLMRLEQFRPDCLSRFGGHNDHWFHRIPAQKINTCTKRRVV